MSDLVVAFALGFISALVLVGIFLALHARLAPDARETETVTRELPDGTKFEQVRTEYKRSPGRPDNQKALQVLREAGLVPHEEYEEE